MMAVSEKVVLDCSYLVPYFLGDEDSQEIVATVEGIQTQKLVWVSQPLLDYELSNVLRTAFKAGRIDEKGIDMAFAALDILPRKLVDLSTLQKRETLDLALRRDLSFYDASYLFLALLENAQLATQDKKLIQAAKIEGARLIK